MFSASRSARPFARVQAIRHEWTAIIGAQFWGPQSPISVNTRPSSKVAVAWLIVLAGVVHLVLAFRARDIELRRRHCVRQRVEASLLSTLETYREQTVVVVSHVSPIKVAVAWSLGVDEGVTFRMQLGLASITTVGARPDGGGYLLSFNDGAHLEGD